MNIANGHLLDRIGTRRILMVMLLSLIVVTATLSWTSAMLVTAVIAIALHGATSWGQLSAQQHRLVSTMPTAAPIVLGLNTSATYIGVASAGVIGAASLTTVGAHNIGWVSLAFYAGALIAAEITHKVIVRHKAGVPAEGVAA
jgi:predicted MFS family arabinose efflux permease